MKWINAEQQVTVSIYDDELDKIMTVEEMLDTYTNEGCPTIYSNPEQAELNSSYNSIKTELEPCEDCISREAVRGILANQRDELVKLHTVNPKDNPKADAMAYGVNWSLNTLMELPSVTPKASEQQPSREWKEIYAESEGSNSWIEFKCPHCGYSFGMESGEYDWHYGDEIPWKYCPICGGSAEHKPYKAESEDKE